MLAWGYSRSRSPDAHLDKIITRPPPTPIRCYLQSDKGRLLFDVATDRGPTKDVPAEAHRRFRADRGSATCVIGRRERRSSRCRKRSPTSRRASNSHQGFCTQRDKLTRAARTQASRRSRATTPSICRCGTRNIRSAQSRRFRHEGFRGPGGAQAVPCAPRPSSCGRRRSLGYLARCTRSALRSRATSSPDLASLRRT